MRTCIDANANVHYDARMFKELIIDLTEAGVAEHVIATRLGLSQPSVNRIKNAKQSDRLDYETAIKLMAMHAELVKAKPAAAAHG